MSAKPEAVREVGVEPRAAKAALRVWKFEIEKPMENGAPQSEFGFALKMPKGARITRVGTQLDRACVFAVVNPAFREEERYFWVANTNSDLPGPGDLEEKFSEAGREFEVVGLEPLGTWLEVKGSVAKHLFEIIVKAALPAAVRPEGRREPGED